MLDLALKLRGSSLLHLSLQIGQPLLLQLRLLFRKSSLQRFLVGQSATELLLVGYEVVLQLFKLDLELIKLVSVLAGGKLLPNDIVPGFLELRLVLDPQLLLLLQLLLQVQELVHQT